MTMADEARLLADKATDLAPGDHLTFGVDGRFFGEEAKLIEGAQSILCSEGETGITFSIAGEGAIHIQA